MNYQVDEAPTVRRAAGSGEGGDPPAGRSDGARLRHLPAHERAARVGARIQLDGDGDAGRAAEGAPQPAADRLRDRRACRTTSSGSTWACWAACRISTRPPSAGSTSSSSATDHVIVNPLRVSADVVNELEHNMLLCYTGATRRSDGVIEDQTARYEGGEAVDAGRAAQPEAAGDGDEERAGAPPAARVRRHAARGLEAEEADVAEDQRPASSTRPMRRRGRPAHWAAR